jgi:hypothetical protein
LSNHIISKGKLKEWLDAGVLAILDHNGDPETHHYLWNQIDEGWRIGVVTEPVSNFSKTWIVCTADHRDHHGFDAGACVEIVVEFEDEPYEEWTENWLNAGGTVWEVENE